MTFATPQGSHYTHKLGGVARFFPLFLASPCVRKGRPERVGKNLTTPPNYGCLVMRTRGVDVHAVLPPLHGFRLSLNGPKHKWLEIRTSTHCVYCTVLYL